MKCDCGSRCDFINAKVVIDVVEKEYYCLKCSKSIFLTKNKKGERALKNRDGSIISTWTI